MRDTRWPNKLRKLITITNTYLFSGEQKEQQRKWILPNVLKIILHQLSTIVEAWVAALGINMACFLSLKIKTRVIWTFHCNLYVRVFLSAFGKPRNVPRGGSRIRRLRVPYHLNCKRVGSFNFRLWLGLFSFLRFL